MCVCVCVQPKDTSQFREYKTELWSDSAAEMEEDDDDVGVGFDLELEVRPPSVARARARARVCVCRIVRWFCNYEQPVLSLPVQPQRSSVVLFYRNTRPSVKSIYLFVHPLFELFNMPVHAHLV